MCFFFFAIYTLIRQACDNQIAGMAYHLYVLSERLANPNVKIAKKNLKCAETPFTLSIRYPNNRSLVSSFRNTCTFLCPIIQLRDFIISKSVPLSLSYHTLISQGHKDITPKNNFHTSFTFNINFTTLRTCIKPQTKTCPLRLFDPSTISRDGKW